MFALFARGLAGPQRGTTALHVTYESTVNPSASAGLTTTEYTMDIKHAAFRRHPILCRREKNPYMARGKPIACGQRRILARSFCFAVSGFFSFLACGACTFDRRPSRSETHGAAIEARTRAERTGTNLHDGGGSGAFMPNRRR